MLRSRKMLGDSATIDHHADHGFVSASPAMNYMELYPFINRLWCKSHVMCASTRPLCDSLTKGACLRRRRL